MSQKLQEYLKKAEVLIEALPYIQRFNRKIIVVKYGGSAMIDETLKKRVIEDVTLLKLVGFKPIIVHGGGKEISRWMEKTGKQPTFVNGLRVTDEETMEVAEMVLGKVNKETEGGDIGFVGEVTKVEPKILEDLLEKDFLPIICPIGLGEDYQTYNINADDAACAIAQAVHAEKLAFLSDVEGIYTDPADASTLISELTIQEGKQLIEKGTITGGMIPKLYSCIEAIQAGVSRVHILDGRIPHCLLLEIFTNRGIGTAIFEGERSRFYYGPDNQ